jgi:hypothetical protein
LILAFASLVFVGVWLYQLVKTSVGDSPNDQFLATVRSLLQSGRSALAEGHFQSAVAEFNTASALGRRNPGVLAALENRQLTHLQSQAALLADLLTESLQEILHRFDGLLEREGQAVFARHYRGKAIVFYAEVRRDASAKYHLGYHLFDGRQEARLEVGDLFLFQHLPLQDPQLLLFGARLAELHRQGNTGWIVHLEPDSGVLLTDPGAVAACCFEVADAEQLRDVVEKQAKWMAELP